uniref:Uncharacterized protein n=1 Tax=Rhipicephalus pulchellus TaxID=72859 RepID=L7LUJ2_RHIPC
MAASPNCLYAAAFIRIRSASAFPTASMAYPSAAPIILMRSASARATSTVCVLFPWATISTRYASASAGNRTVAVSSFSRRNISFSSMAICLRLSTTSISISSLRIFCFTLAAWSSYASCASAFRALTSASKLAFCSWYIRLESSILVLAPYLTSMADFSHSASRMPASLSAWATPMSASRLTAAVRARPSEVRYSTRSKTSLMVKLRISMPMRPMSGAATSRTSEANWSLSRYTSSTVSVPKIARRCPSSVCRITPLMWSTSLPRNCSAAVERNSFSVITLHCATPVTVSGTPCDVSTCSQRGVSVITSNVNLCTSVTSHHAHAQPPTTIFLPAFPQHPPDTMRASLGPTVCMLPMIYPSN